MAFTCPRCARVSHSPEDERQGYCGACRDWTGRDLQVPCDVPAELVARHRDTALAAIAAAASGGRPFGSRPVLLPLDPNTLATFITSSHTDNQSPAEFSARRQSEVDDEPGSDAATWQPGYREL